MIVLIYNKEKTITKILSCAAEKDIQKLGLEHYKVFEETNAYIGLSLEFINNKGMIKSDKQLLEENLIQLQEDEVLDVDKIRKLSIQEQVDIGLIELKENEEIRGSVIVTLSDDEMKAKYPHRYPSEQAQEESQEKTVDQAISEKQYELQTISSEYLKADILGFENTKSELKKRYLDVSTELETLQKNK